MSAYFGNSSPSLSLSSLRFSNSSVNDDDNDTPQVFERQTDPDICYTTLKTSKENGNRIHGYLKKFETSIIDRFKVRYFVLDEKKCALSYFRRKESQEPLGEIFLKNATVQLESDRDKDNQFTIDTTDRKYIMLASNQITCLFWVNKIQAIRNSLAPSPSRSFSNDLENEKMQENSGEIVFSSEYTEGSDFYEERLRFNKHKSHMKLNYDDFDSVSLTTDKVKPHRNILLSKVPIKKCMSLDVMNQSSSDRSLKDFEFTSLNPVQTDQNLKEDDNEDDYQSIHSCDFDDGIVDHETESVYGVGIVPFDTDITCDTDNNSAVFQEAFDKGDLTEKPTDKQETEMKKEIESLRRELNQLKINNNNPTETSKSDDNANAIGMKKSLEDIDKEIAQLNSLKIELEHRRAYQKYLENELNQTKKDLSLTVAENSRLNSVLKTEIRTTNYKLTTEESKYDSRLCDDFGFVKNDDDDGYQDRENTKDGSPSVFDYFKVYHDTLKQTINEKEWESFRKRAVDVSPERFLASESTKKLLRQGTNDYRTLAWKIIIDARVDHIRKNKKENYFKSLLELASKTKPNAEQVELDLPRTLPNNIHFQNQEGLHIESLRRVLLAYGQHNPEVGYLQGINMIAAIFLLFLDIEDSFWGLVCVFDCIYPQDYFNDMLSLQIDIAVIDELLKLKMGSLHQHLVKNDVRTVHLANKWFLSAFVGSVNHETLFRIWDSFLFEGMNVLFRFSLAILCYNKDELLNCSNQIEVLSLMEKCASNIKDPDRLTKLAHDDMNLSIKDMQSLRKKFYSSIRSNGFGKELH